MKTVQKNTGTSPEQTREVMKKDYDRRGTSHPDIEIGDLIVLNAKKSQEQTTKMKFNPPIVRPF